MTQLNAVDVDDYAVKQTKAAEVGVRAQNAEFRDL
jgi:hypothetical protein